VHDAGAIALEPTLAAKVEFLSRAETYPHRPDSVSLRETHMSWVFLAGDRAYKLKKPVQFPYLDFSTLARREAACRAELELNRRLAPDIYLEVAPLMHSAGGLSIGGGGNVVDWLVVMRRLDERNMLDRTIADGRLETWQLDLLVGALVGFYRRAVRVFLAPAHHLAEWRRALAYNRGVLLDDRLGLPPGLVQHLDSVQRRFLARCGDLLAERAHRRRIVDGHGDLRPEHIWLGDPVKIIDCLEFNPRLRAVDPYDEVAFLSVECERLGAAWAGDYIKRHVTRALGDGPTAQLFAFYRCQRATLRARLAIAHLLEPNPRSPEKWPALAHAYLSIAAKQAARIERMLRTREGLRASGSRAGGGSLRRARALRAGFRLSRGPVRRPAGTAGPRR
jgi:aminoglycoside phosphotransferase family enzyme